MEYVVWMTTRRIRPGTVADFERAFATDPHPDRQRRAYAYWSEDDREVIGVSLWDSKESCDAWPASEAEARRRRAMAYVVEDRDSFHRGRELATPGR